MYSQLLWNKRASPSVSFRSALPPAVGSPTFLRPCRRGASDRATPAAGHGGAVTSTLAVPAAAAAAAAVAGLGYDSDGDAAQSDDRDDGDDVGRELRWRDAAGWGHPPLAGCAGAPILVVLVFRSLLDP